MFDQVLLLSTIITFYHLPIVIHLKITILIVTQKFSMILLTFTRYCNRKINISLLGSFCFVDSLNLCLRKYNIGRA